MKSEISVIIPVYNAEKFIAKCLDSIISQTFQDIEIICIDDCSTDNSKQILKDYAQKDLRIKTIFFDKNKKQGGARNAGLDIAQGKYVTFVDADDYIEPTMLEKMYKVAERNYCDLVIANMENSIEKDSEDLEQLKKDLNYKDTELKTGFYCFDPYFKTIRLNACGKLYKKEIIDEYKIKFPENLIHEDDAFYWFYMPFVHNLYYINENLYHRVINTNSTMYKFRYNNEGILDHIRIIKVIYHFLKKQNTFNLYKECFFNYVKRVIDNKDYQRIRNRFILEIALNTPEILSVALDEIKLLVQLHLNKNKKIAFWGASIFLEEFLHKYNIKNENIVGIIDKDRTKTGKKLCNYEILPIEKINDYGIETVIFTIKNNNFYPQVESYLKENYPQISILPNVFTPKSKYKPTVPLMCLERFSVHLVEHCNLNCQSCNNFSPIAEKKFANLESYENDIKRIAKLTNKKLKRIYLIGGEPLLHPNLIEFLRVSREHLPNTRLIILTNGILLPTLGEDFWNACNQYNIAIEVTKYPIKVDFDKVEEIAKRYDVEYGYFCNTGTVIKTSNRYPIDVNGKQDMVSSFKSCECANICIFLRDGRLYTCAIAPNIEHFNRHFGYNIPLTEKDGIDIYKAKDEKQIMKFLAKPIPFCKYCNVKDRVYGVDWTVSKKEIKEWI